MNPPSPPPLSATDRTRVRRGGNRAVTDRAVLWEVLDAGLVCHLCTVVDGSPLVLPTGYGRDGDTLYLHGSTGALSLRTAAAGVDICVAVTLVDGLVYARSVFNHSMNYRSAVVHAVAVPVVDPAAKLTALRVITEHLTPGSWDHARPPTDRELAKTAVLAVDLAEAAVKVRAGGPGDDEEDIAAGTAWAGVVPMRTVFDEPVPAPDLDPARVVPEHVTRARAR